MKNWKNRFIASEGTIPNSDNYRPTVNAPTFSSSGLTNYRNFLKDRLISKD